MSFQDIGRKNTSSTNNCNIHSSGPNPNTNIYNNATNSSQYSQNQTFHNRGAAATGGLQPASTALSDGHDGGNDYAAVSQAILQYQQNIGILSNIIQTIGTQDDGPLLQQQYNLQIDVIQQLGSKIELQLQQKEKMMANMNRTDASRSRATHIKLTRDYKWVETKYKNLVLEGRKKRNNIEAQKRIEMEQENRRNFEEGIDSDTARLQMQLRDDVRLFLHFFSFFFNGSSRECFIVKLLKYHLLLVFFSF